MNAKLKISKGWTLFLDRDGVINERLIDDYVKTAAEFRFSEGVLAALNVFSNVFERIIVVSNQQGVGKGLMTKQDLQEVNDYMLASIHKVDARIDKVYYCTALAQDNSPLRKPKTGMAFKAKDDFPEINFKKSIMVGDSISDMQFGKKLNMRTAFITNGYEVPKVEEGLIDYTFQNLAELANFIDVKTTK